jgi:hypothetical protein
MSSMMIITKDDSKNEKPDEFSVEHHSGPARQYSFQGLGSIRE